jgi:Holliday junction resolvase YEN1
MCAILIHLFKFLTILSRSNVKEAGDQVTIYKSECIETNPLVSLNREALFFMAILCGGDYDKVSLIPTIFQSFNLISS